MGTSRNRALPSDYQSGGVYEQWYYNAFKLGTYNGYSGYASNKTMSDITDSQPYPDHNLTAIHKYCDPLTLNGWAYTSPYWKNYIDYSPQNRASYLYGPDPNIVDWGYWRTKALANVNPRKTMVDVPLFLFELRDFPRMLKNIGDILAAGKQAKKLITSGTSRAEKGRPSKVKLIADTHLAQSFGWAPLFGDLISLLGLADEFERRIALINEAKSGARISRKIGGTSSQSTWVYSLVSAQLELNYVTTRELKVWYTAKLNLTSEYPTSSIEIQKRVTRDLLGLNISASKIWNAIPWTWLIDYFVNIGDFLEANKGNLSFSVSDLNVMAQETIDDIPSHKSGNVSWSGGKFTTVSKQRSVVTNPNASVHRKPFLTNRHIGILSALVVARTLK